jgi:hypothetical protein
MIGFAFGLLPAIDNIYACDEKDKCHDPEKILLHKRFFVFTRSYLIPA